MDKRGSRKMANIGSLASQTGSIGSEQTRRCCKPGKVVVPSEVLAQQRWIREIRVSVRISATLRLL
jgi:hypothetical protein